MLSNFQLAAISKQRDQVQLLRIPMLQRLQTLLTNTWEKQLTAFCGQAQEIPFNAGYQPEENELFALMDFDPPTWLSAECSTNNGTLDPIDQAEETIATIKGIVAFARDESGDELVLFQNFSSSHVIRPGFHLLLKNDTYVTNERPGLTLDNKLSAVYLPSKQKLLFHSFHIVNIFLPLGDYYQEATEQQIREVLAHPSLDPIDVDTLVAKPSEWVKKQFAIVRDTGVLDRYTSEQIKACSVGYDVDIEMQDGRIIIPVDPQPLKKLLKFLNEDLFKGAITETLYETNSKREAD